MKPQSLSWLMGLEVKVELTRLFRGLLASEGRQGPQAKTKCVCVGGCFCLSTLTFWPPSIFFKAVRIQSWELLCTLMHTQNTHRGSVSYLNRKVNLIDCFSKHHHQYNF